MNKTMSLEEVKKLPPLSDERIEEIENFKEDFTDPECPPLTEEQLARLRPVREVHPEWFKPRKGVITIRLDLEVIEKYKSMGKGYQTRINADLRKALGLDWDCSKYVINTY